MRSSVIFGAGAIGLAFLGDLLDQSGYRITFADVRDDLVRWLNERGEYTIRVTDATGETMRRIGRVRALNSSGYGRNVAPTRSLRKAVATADILFTAAGEGALVPIGRVIGDALRYRVVTTSTPLNIICCENIKDPGSILRAAILGAAGDLSATIGARVGICRSVISRMTPVVADPANITTEAYAQIPVEKSPWLGAPPDVVGLRLVEDFEAYKMQKLIMHNMTHAVAAYLGYFLGKKDVCDCVRDPLIGSATKCALAESHRIMRAEFALRDDELHEHAEDLFRRYGNPSLGHTVPNVARDPIRKLAPGDRFHSALTLAERHHIPVPSAELGAAFALAYDRPDDVSAPRLQEMIASKGIDAVLNEVCGLDPQSDLAARLKRRHSEVRKAAEEQRSTGRDNALRTLIECAMAGG
jgi:mannitol-1-phosphate 5-dehydrogenase